MWLWRVPGGSAVKRILRSRLPERFADKVPPMLTEVAVGVTIPAVMTLARMSLIPWAADRAPFAFVFIAAVGATVLAGWRSGMLAVIVGVTMLLTIFLNNIATALVMAQVGVEAAAALGIDPPAALRISNVDPRGPAAHAGLRRDDVITHIDGRPIINAQEALNRVAAMTPGSALAIRALRGGEALDLNAMLEERPPGGERPQ